MNGKIQQVKAKYRYSITLLRQLVISDFKLRYKNSVLGYAWTLLRPLALFLTLYVIFVRFLKVGEGVEYFSVYLLLGIVFWNYFVEVTVGGVQAIVGKGDILRKLSFPRYVIVVSGSVSALINFALNMVVIGFFMLINDVPFRINGILVIFPIVEMFIFSLSISFLLSAMYVRFRDIGYIWEVIIQGAFYATPILYPLSKVLEFSDKAGKILMLNPMAQIIQDARSLLITPQTQTISTLYGTGYARLMPLTLAGIVAIYSWLYFKKRAPYFAEEL